MSGLNWLAAVISSEILASMKMIAEGVKTTSAALALGARHGVELPIATQMAAVLDGRCDVRTAVEVVDAATAASRGRVTSAAREIWSSSH